MFEVRLSLRFTSISTSFLVLLIGIREDFFPIVMFELLFGVAAARLAALLADN